MPFQIIKSNKDLPPVDVLIRFEQAGSEAPIRNPFRDPPENTPKADIRVIPSPRAGIPNKYIYSVRKSASWEDVAACYREIFEAIPRHGWASVAVPLCPSTLTPHEVYRIACSEIRQALDERDMQIVLIVADAGAIHMPRGLLSLVRNYIRLRFDGGEPLFGGLFGGEKASPTAPAYAELEIEPDEDEKLVESEPVMYSLADRTDDYEDDYILPPQTETDFGSGYFVNDRDAPPSENASETCFSDSDDAGEDNSAPGTPLFSADPSDRRKHQAVRIPKVEPGNGARPIHSSIPSFDLLRDEPRFDPAADRIILDESFSQAVLRLIKEKRLTDPQCYSRANLSRAVFNKLKQNALNPGKVSYKPSKSTALALAVALELDIDEAKDLLQKAGFALSHSSKGDIIVEYFLANHLYDIFELNEVLFKFGEPLLGSL